MRQDFHRGEPATSGKASSPHRTWLRRLTMAAALAVSLGGTAPAYSAGGDIIWQRSDALAGKQEAKAMAADSGGNAVIAGYQSISGGINDDYYTIKMKADGSGIAWRAAYDNSGGQDQATAVVVDGNDNVIVTGFAWNGLNNDIHTIKYDSATGAVLWQHTLNGAANGNDVGTSVAVDGLNNVYVGGYSQDAAGNNSYIIVKYAPSGVNPDGSPAWTTIADGAVTGINRVNSITAGNGIVAVTGQSWNGTAMDMLTVVFNATDGEQLWERRYSTGAANSCVGRYVKLDNAGNVIVTGSAHNGIDLDMYTAKYNGAAGTIMWERTCNGAYDDEPNGLVIGPNGNVYVTGYTWTLTAQNDFYTVKLDGGNGSILWEKNFNSTNGNDDITSATGIVIDPVGDLFVTGYTVSDKNYDFQTLKYKKDNGNQLWQASFNGPAGKNDRPIGIALSPTGEVLVAGWTDTAANDLDIHVIKYDPGLLDPPTGVTAQAQTNTSALLNWIDNSGNEDGFSIERCQNLACTAFAEIATVPAGVTTYTDNSLTPTTYYSYRVRAFSAASGYSHYSATATTLTVVVTVQPPADTYIYNGLYDSDDYANAIAIGPDNNPVIAGQSNDYPAGYTTGVTSYDYLITKLNRSDMSIVWTDRYNDPSDAADIATCVAVDSNNSVAVSGYATLYNGTSTDVNSLYTIRYPASGPPALRADQYNGPVAGGATDDRAVAVAIASASDSSNNSVVVGYGMNAAGNNDIYVLKYNPDGTRAWAATPFDGSGGDDHPTSVVLALDGSIFVTGYSETAATSNLYRIFTAKYNGTTGTRTWTDLYAPVAGQDSRGQNLTLDRSGDLYVTGTSGNAAGNQDIYTVKYSGTSSTAQRLWEKFQDGAVHGDDSGVSIKADRIDGSIVVAGTTASGAGNNDFTIVKYSPAGETILSKTYLRPGSDDTAKSLGIDSNGNIYVAGNTGVGPGTDSLTVKFDYLGNISSATLFSGVAGSFDESAALAINSLDEVFVAGYSEKATPNGEALIYNADVLVYKIAPDMSLPYAPYSITTTSGYANVNLAWLDRSAVKEGYHVERRPGACSAATTAPWESIASVTAPSFADTGLNTGSTYCYRINTYQNSGAASRWIEKEAVTLSPPAPGSVTATVTSTTTVVLGWTDTTTGETGFRIERCSGAGCTNFAPVGTAAANATTFTDSSTCNATVYRYRVLAFGAGWESPAGTIPPAVTTRTPAAPVLTAARVSEAEIQLTWTDPNSDETGHRVERCIGAGCTGFAAVASLPAGTNQFRDSGLTAGTTYTYRVTAYKTATCPWEQPSNAAAATTTLISPNGLTATATSTTSINLAWTDNTASETGYSVEKCIGDICSNFGEIAAIAPNSTSFTDSGVCINETSSYRVKALRDAVSLSNSGDGCWTRRSPMTITGFQQNYQTRLTIPYDIDMLAGFDDIRFVDTSAGTELPYWIESKTDSVSAVVWVKTGMNNTIYLYYGNSTATSSSNGSAVFDFFDDFSGTALDPARWTATGSASVANGALRVDTGAVHTLAPILTNPQGKVFEMKSQWLTGAGTNSGLNIANAQSTLVNNAGSNALAYFVTDSGTTANLLSFAANGTAASYNVVTGTLSATVSTGTALYNPFVSNGQYTRKPASGVWSPPQGGTITRIRIKTATEACCDAFRVYNAAGTLLAERRGTVDIWLDIAPTTGIYTIFQTDGSVNGGFGGDVPEVIVTGTSATGVLNTYRILGYDFQDTSKISYFIRNLNYTESFRSTYTGTWSAAPYLWLGYYTGAAAGTADIDDMLVDWVRVRKHATTEPTVAVGAKEASDCFTFGSPWSGSYTNIATASTGAPGTSVLTATKASEVQINLSWTDAAGDESGYKIERCVGEGCSNFSQVAVRNANVLTYNDTGLAPGTTYSYRVKAYKSTACSWETTSNIATQATTITGPTTLSAVAASTTQVTLTWVNSTASETSFVIERCEGVGCTDFTQAGTASAKATSFNDGTVCSGRTYTYRVKAINVMNNIPQWESTPSPAAATVTPGYANLLADPGFEKTTTGWPTAVGTLTGTSFDTTVMKDGGRSLKLSGTGASLGRSQSVAVTAGRSYVLSGWINAALTTGRAQCDVSGTGIDSTGIVVAAGTPQNNAGWVELSETVTIPAGTSTVSVRCFADSTPNGSVYFDAISLAPETVTLTATRTSELQVALSWLDSATDETGYRVERCTGADCIDFAQIGTVGANVTTYASSGLTPNTTYRYRIQGYKATSCSWDTSYSAIAQAVTTPAAPINLAATTPNTTQVSLTWTDTTASETGFEVERCTGAGCTTFARINTTGANATSFPDVTAASGTTYRYRVRALSSSAGWYSGYSGEVAATTPVPTAPVLTATAGSEVQVNLTWTNPTSDETGYKVYRCGGAGCEDFSLVATLGANVTTYNDSGRSAGSSNSYYVQGYKTGSWTSNSNVVSITLTPAAPTSLAVTAVDTTQTRLTWTNKTTSHTGISIERCQGASCSSFAAIATVGTGVSSFNDTTACNNQPTSYRVQAVNSTVPWSSAYSNTASITIPAPPAPAGLTATRASEIQINLAWTDNNTDETGFKIERCAGAGCTTFAQVAAVLANVKTYNDTAVIPGTTYRYQVRAYKLPSLGCGWDSNYTNIAEATASIIAPSALTATPVNSTSVRLSWTNSTVSETGYKIERCTGSGCSDFTEVTAVSGKTTTWTDTAVVSSTSYTYRIRATSSTAAWDSAYSNSSTAVTPAQGAPGNLAGTANTTRITLTWADNTVDENGFKIERCEASGCDTFTQVATVGANVATWSDDSVCNDHSYSYRIRAYNTAIPYETPYSAAVTVVPPVPAPPVLTVIRGSEVQLNLSWTDPTTDETGYRIESCPGSGCTEFAQIGSVTGTTFTDTGLVPGYTYTYRIKAYKSAACPWETLSNTASGTTTITAPASLAATAVNTTRIDLSWSDSSTSETGYKIERCSGAECTDFREITATGMVTSWSDTTVTSGASYRYRVRATRNIPYTWDSDYSNIAAASTPAAPAPGALSAAQVSNSQINISWTDTATDETGYRIERCSGIDCANFTEIATLAANSATYSNTGLSSSTTYCFRIRGYKSGTSPWMSAYSNTACAVTMIDGPSTLTATPVNAFTVKLTWMDSAAGESGFTIEQQVWNGEWVAAASVGANVTSHSDSIGIEPQKSYTYRIKAFRGAENSTYSNQVTVTTPAFKAGDMTCDTPVTGAPIFTSQPVTTATEGVLYTYHVTAAGQESTSITSYLLTTKPAGMVISESGTITWTAGFDQDGERNVTVRVTDSLGRTSDQNYTITVANADRQPTFASTAPTTALESHLYQYQAVAADPDGATVTFTLTTAPAGMIISPSGLVEWTPALEQIGTHPVEIEAAAAGLSTTQAFTVTVGANHSPAISSNPVTTAAEGKAYSYQVVATDANSDSLTYSLTTAPAGMAVSSSGLISWNPAIGAVGSNPVALTVSDGILSVTQSFTVMVAANHAPTITSTPVTSGTEGVLYTYTVVSTDADGDTLTYALRSAPAGMTLSPAGVISWTPTFSQAGTHLVTVRITDPRSLYTDHTFTVTVIDVPQPPTITSTPSAFCLIGTTYTYQVTATDPNGMPITYTLDAAPAGMTITSNGLISWTPSATGSYPVTVRVANANYAATQPFTVMVSTAPAAPTLITQSGINTGCSTSTAHTLSWNAVTIPDSDPAHYTVQLDTVSTFNSANLKQSGWISGTSWTTPIISNATWYWRVKARDSVHPAAESAYSATGSFSDTNEVYTCGGICGFWDCSCDNTCGSSSCPLVYSWNGDYTYETDLQGPALSQIKKGSRNVSIYQPSYIVLEGGLTPDENQQYKVKIWESLQEASIIDEARLLAFDYPDGYQIASSGAENTYYYGYAEPFRLYTLKNPALPVSVIDKHGNDVLAASSAVDNSPAPMNPDDPDNYYTIDFGTIQHPEHAKLVIDGWQDINSKIYLSTIQIQPYIELVDQNGQWVKVRAFGMPAGDLKAMIVDLSNLFLSSDHRIRLHLGIKKAQVWVFDRIRLDDSAPVAVSMQQLQATSANLQFGGQAIQSMVNRDHRIIATDEVQPLIPTYFGYGNFTRYGDVLPLITQRDDKYALLNYADKVEVTFPVPMPPQPGMTRGFVLLVDNYYKEFKDYKYLEPLPFHGMSDYPYPATESYPTDEEHNLYRQLYNTRIVAP